MLDGLPRRVDLASLDQCLLALLGAAQDGGFGGGLAAVEVAAATLRGHGGLAHPSGSEDGGGAQCVFHGAFL